MNVLEKILEEVDNMEMIHVNYRRDTFRDGFSSGSKKCCEIIRSHMSEIEKVTSAEIISRNIDGKPYYEIKYKKVGEDHYTVGYSSYKLDYVVNWMNEYLEFCGEAKVSISEGKDTNVHSNDDMEEKIREHIAECLQRIDNIRSFVESKWYTNNDEKCIRNIEVLKTTITALEGYLSSKKKSGNDGWIPVEERLPESDGFYLATLDGEICGQEEAFAGLAEFEHGKWVDDEEGYKCVLAWQPLPNSYKGE